MAKDRWEAKQAKDYPRADALRNTLLQEGWIIKDSNESYEIEPK
jgi:cysteinyl-tRNA synthetase